MPSVIARILRPGDVSGSQAMKQQDGWHRGSQRTREANIREEQRCRPSSQRGHALTIEAAGETNRERNSLRSVATVAAGSNPASVSLSTKGVAMHFRLLGPRKSLHSAPRFRPARLCLPTDRRSPRDWDASQLWRFHSWRGVERESIPSCSLLSCWRRSFLACIVSRRSVGRSTWSAPITWV
jgi:hypothetical protein